MALPVPAEQQNARPEELGVIQLGELDQAPSLYGTASDGASGPAELAARLLERYRRRDAGYPDLDQIAASKAVEFHCTPDLSLAKGWIPFSVSSVALPGDLYAHSAAPGSRMGLLSGLDRVWVAHDTSLWLWNVGGASGGAVQKFDDFSEPVLDVEAVVPAKDVFVDAVKHVLVVSTKTQLHLYAVSTDFEIYDTGLAIPAEGLGTPMIRSTSEGRLFFVAENTALSLWEGRYSNTESWFRAKTGKTCHWGHGLRSGILGSLLFGAVERLEHTQGERVIDMCIDDSLSLLYTLTSRSTINVFKYTRSSVWHERSYTVDAMQAHLQAAVPPADSQLVAAVKNLRLVSLAAITDHESRFVRVMALAASGHRVFFRHSSVGRGALQATYIHPLATDQQVSGNFQGRVLGGGTVLAALTDKHDLFLSTLDTTRIRHQADMGTSPSFSELSGWVPNVPGTLKCVAPAASKQDEYYVLTDRALVVVRRRRFDERLETTELPAVQLANTYGHMEICAAALAVATRPTTQVSRQQRDAAVATYFRFGGLPVFKKDIEAARSSFLTDPKSVIGSSALQQQQQQHQQKQQVSVRLSALFDGLAVYTTRIVSELWDSRILIQKKVSGSNGSEVHTESNVDIGKLEHIYRVLGGLVDFLEKNRSFSEGMSSRPSPPAPLQALQALSPGDVNVLNQAEHLGMQVLARLVRSAQQGIAFLLLILTETASTPHGIDTLLRYFSRENHDKFLAMTFSQFFVSGKHNDVARELVTCLVNFVINRGDSIDSVARVIQDRCESYCSAADVLVYKALEYLHAAKAEKGEDQRLHSLHRSAELFRKAAAAIQIETLRDIVAEFDAFGFYTGAVEVALAVAAETDLANVAVGYLREHKPVGDPREFVYQAKLRVYDVIFDEVLAKHPQLVDDDQAVAGTDSATYRLMLASPDEVFHFALYDWFLRTGRADRLARVSTPFVQPYLQAGAKSDLRAADLLWKWYQRRGDLLAAADVLLNVAKGGLPVPMTQRVEFLSRAMGYCNCPFPPERRQHVANLTTMVTAYLRIAVIQSDVLQQVEQDGSLDPTQKTHAESQLNSKLLTLSDLFNEFADPLGYHTVCLAIFEAADYRDPVEIRECWDKLLSKTRFEDEVASTQHYAHVGALVTRLAAQFWGRADFVFPLDMLLPLLEQYSEEYCSDAPVGWLVDAFANGGVPYDVLYTGLVRLLQERVFPFTEPGPARQVADDICYLVEQWQAQGDADVVRAHITDKDMAVISDLVGRAEVARLIAA